VADWLWLDADVVVEQSLRDAARGRAVSIPSLKWKLITAVARLLPASVAAAAGSRGR
ncbi:MAG TPA: short-chain dehydrogenase, partial [Microbacterium sp.]|nr:short-chain dehydrogenase [Microbacterium sp.]